MGMRLRITLSACLLLCLGILATAQQSAQDELVQLTRNWLKGVSTGDRAGLNAIMDPRFIATTPVGEVLTKEHLVPDDASQAVQQLPAMELDSPLVRVYGDTAVLMGRLKSVADAKQVMNGTFVYAKRDNAWKLVAMHLSSQR
jgi:hypothetical protein